MLFLLFFVASLGISLGERRFYHTYNGTVISNETYQYYRNEGVDGYCVLSVEDCDPNEGRRLDGTCNNLNAPSRGGPNTPGTRELPAEFCGVDRPQGECKDLRPSREIRTTLLADGRASSSRFTNLVPSFWLFFTTDTGFPQDSRNYFARTTPDCCSAQGASLPRCIQVEIPEDDFLHRYTGTRCQNMTVPITFQNVGCIANGTTPQRVRSFMYHNSSDKANSYNYDRTSLRINRATPEIELSQLYGITEERLNTKIRSFENGELRTEVENGRIWPPSHKVNVTLICVNNVLPRETRCHDGAETTMNAFLGVHLGSVWFYRLHNFWAQQLAQQNPSWDDERLFRTAREINIAVYYQIVFYELLAQVMGYENLVRDGVLSESPLHRDLYDENEIPRLSIEYPYALRWVHNIQESHLQMLDSDGNLVRNIRHTEILFRTGFVTLDNNPDYFTMGLLRQPSGGIDYTVDPDIAENTGVPSIQRNLDIFTNDHLKGRYFGLPPYVKYLNLCFGANVTSYEDLEEFVDFEGIQNLKNVYENVEDIELMSGIWMEKMVEGGNVPRTFYCLVSKQLQRFIKMDRFHYERPNRPNAFNEAQLLEIRKWTIAKLLCTVGDGVTKIQPSAFLLTGPGNEIGPCDETTPTIDYSVFNYCDN